MHTHTGVRDIGTSSGDDNEVCVREKEHLELLNVAVTLPCVSDRSTGVASYKPCSFCKVGTPLLCAGLCGT